MLNISLMKTKTLFTEVQQVVVERAMDSYTLVQTQTWVPHPQNVANITYSIRPWSELNVTGKTPEIIHSNIISLVPSSRFP